MRKKEKPKDLFVNDAFLAELFERLLDLRDKIKEGIDPQTTNSSLLNMKQYLNLRKYDFSHFQDDLTKVGLSSFGRSQAHIEASVIVALRMLSHALGRDVVLSEPHLSYEASHAIMEKNATIFSSSSDKTKIMITVPSNYNEEEDWFTPLCDEGVHLFRINTAHDDVEVWADMAKAIKEVKNKTAKIYVDLAGPKIRTVLDDSKKKKKIKVFYGDKVLLKAASSQNTKPKRGIYKAVIGCTLDRLGSITQVGDAVFVDDGKVQMRVEEIDGEDIVCVVVTNNDKGSKIKDEKGINFPNSDISLRAISVRDKEILSHICDYADIIGISFAQSADDIYELIGELEALGKSGEVGIVAKIETKKGVKNLPLILEALSNYGNSGVMIARGDLAIEIGFENLAYMQQEILDLCSAAHMPVILATQVLENKMKTNIPSRAEISDVVFAHKAECVMLNKGLYALETVKILKTIFSQMDLVFRKNKLLYNASFEWK
ncbi:MAG: pyruvate kinase [Campylobacterota bacterium]|nr:pyruvate kinase [Campylobacterota bacterium]